MNLEDRLRSHMHSGDDLFVDSGRDAGAITAAGRRRTRRNQIGGAAAGGMLALALVFGVSTQLGDDGSETFANESTAAQEGAAGAEAAIEMADSMQESEAFDDLSILDPAADFVAYEIVIGVGDGFAGLRLTEGGLVAIESDDGLEWTESMTSGIPADAEVTALTHGDGVFAAAFMVFDEATGATRSSIGTSADLRTWDVEEIVLGEEFSDPFVGDVALRSGEVVAVTAASPPFDEEADTFAGTAIFTIRGPIGGPYLPTQLSDEGFGVGQLRSAGDVAMFTVSTETGSNVWASSGGEWALVRTLPIDEFPTISATGGEVYLVTGVDVERTSDGGNTWLPVATPTDVGGDGSSATAVSSEDTVAVVFSVFDARDNSTRYVLAAGNGGTLTEVSLDGVVPDRAFVSLVAVSGDEVLLEVFPEPDVFDEDLAASGGLLEVDPESREPTDEATPRYVRVPLG